MGKTTEAEDEVTEMQAADSQQDLWEMGTKERKTGCAFLFHFLLSNSSFKQNWNVQK